MNPTPEDQRSGEASGGEPAKGGVGDAAAPGTDLFADLYAELRQIAAAYLRTERRDHTLQPTALVNEAFIKLAERTGAAWNDQAHFRASAAAAMRQILVDHARRRGTDKRGGGWMKVSLDSGVAIGAGMDIDVLALDEALAQLHALDSRKARVVELRFFAGMTCDEAAEVVGVASKTAEADWYMARAWLRRRLAGGASGD
jgi:RNA polymerase sigma-70 factor (ECF subfamily)